MYEETFQPVSSNQSQDPLSISTNKCLPPKEAGNKSNKEFQSTISAIDKDLSNSISSRPTKYKPSDNEKIAFQSTLKKCKEDAAKGIFTKVKFIVGEKTIEKTPIYNFFHCKRELANDSVETVDFSCIICNIVFHEKFKESTNLNSHLKTAHTNTSDDTLTNWFKAYKNAKNSSNKKGKLF